MFFERSERIGVEMKLKSKKKIVFVDVASPRIKSSKLSRYAFIKRTKKLERTEEKRKKVKG